MHLSKYLTETDTSVIAFAKCVGVTRQAVYRYLHGQLPRRLIIERIQAATKGRVTANDLMNCGEGNGVRQRAE